MKKVFLICSLFLVSCIEIDHTGEVDVNHNINLDEIDIILTVDSASEISGSIELSAEDVASNIANLSNP